MPTEKEINKLEFLSRIMKDYPGIFRIIRANLFCIYCNCTVTADKLFSIKQHLATFKHIKAKKLRSKNTEVQTLTLLTSDQGVELNP